MYGMSTSMELYLMEMKDLSASKIKINKVNQNNLFGTIDTNSDMRRKF